jgi:tetratricopeptide (TPR) repeat protein
VYSFVVLPVVPSINQVDYCFNVGNANFNKSNYQKAIECYDQVIKLNPQIKEAWCNKGIALCRLGKYQDAIGAFDQALNISPDYSNAWRNKSLAQKAMGRKDGAKQAF